MKERNIGAARHQRHLDWLWLGGRIFCAMLILAGIILLIRIWEDKEIDEDKYSSAGQVISAPEREREILTYDGKDYVLRRGLETILAIGYDASSEKSADADATDFDQADMLFLIVADKTAKEYKTLHINRDSMTKVKELTSKGVQVNETVEQIALAYSYGGTNGIRCRNTVDAVSHLLGDGLSVNVKINHYVAIGMDAVPLLNDSVGGVTLTVMDDIDNELRAGTIITLEGDQALRYVRARESLDNPTNLHRMERQKQYLEAFRPLFIQNVNDNPSFILEELTMLGNKMYSDCQADRLAEIVTEIADMNGGGYLTLEGEARQGETYVEFYPDEKAMNEMVLDLFYEEAE